MDDSFMYLHYVITAIIALFCECLHYH